MDVPAARSVFAADALTSPGVGTGVEQVSAALPQFLASAATQSSVVIVRRIRNGGTGHWVVPAAAAAAAGSRRGVTAGGSTGATVAGAGAEIGVLNGRGVQYGADAIGLAIAEARPLGVQVFCTCPCRLIQKLNLPQMIQKPFSKWHTRIYNPIGSNSNLVLAIEYDAILHDILYSTVNDSRLMIQSQSTFCYNVLKCRQCSMIHIN